MLVAARVYEFVNARLSFFLEGEITGLEVFFAIMVPKTRFVWPISAERR